MPPRISLKGDVLFQHAYYDFTGLNTRTTTIPHAIRHIVESISPLSVVRDRMAHVQHVIASAGFGPPEHACGVSTRIPTSISRSNLSSSGLLQREFETIAGRMSFVCYIYIYGCASTFRDVLEIHRQRNRGVHRYMCNQRRA